MKRELISIRESRPWQGIPAIERAANGRLWCAFFTGGPTEPHPDNAIVLCTRAAADITWSSPAVVIPPTPHLRAYDPALWHDPSDRLWLFYNLAGLATGDFSTWARHCADASGPTLTWSAPQRIAIEAPYAFRLNKPTALSNGDWLLPVTWSRQTPNGWFFREPRLHGVAISTDHGATWRLHGEVVAQPHAMENMVVELRDGRPWMLIRTRSGVLWESYSADGGYTWSAGAPSAIVNPGVRFFIRRLSSGRLLLINCPNPSKRQGLRAYLSLPEHEQRFGPGLELDARDQVSYPDAIETPDGLIHAVHDCNRSGTGEILMDSFSEAEILAIQG